MKIAVFGLGYVGCVSAACFANEGHDVYGVDVHPEKVDIINKGKSPIVETGLDQLVEKVVGKGKLKATTDYIEAVHESDISLICVGTPSNRNGSVSLDYIFRVAEQVGDALRKVNHYHVFVIRSTVPPGTLGKAMDIIAKTSGKKIVTDFGGCSNPEFLREGSALNDFYNPPYTVIGEWDQRSGDVLAEIYRSIDAPLIRTDVKVAEMVKYANNVFHAVKVNFGNEIGTICKSYGIDSHKLMEIFCMDDKLNLSSYYLKPGFAFGGSCLPKDVRALAYQAKERDLELPMLQSLMPSNQEHIRRAIDLVLAYGKKRLGILGISFKEDTDDLRESPMVEVVETLLGKGYDIRIYDRNVHLARLFGANKEYINKKIPHISNLMEDNIENVLNHAEILIIGNKNPEFSKIVQELNSHYIVIDFVRILNDLHQTHTRYEGLCW
ncbi:MAG: nucleotide sugar dehydrogenase [Calditrichia bacterium]